MRKFWQGWAPEVYAIAFGMWGIICVIVTVVIFASVIALRLSSISR